MKLKIKKLSQNAVIPSYANPGDAGLDLTATSKQYCEGYIEYGTSLAFEIPENHAGLIFPRSSISNKDQVLSNSVGVIDSGYRGEVKFRFKDSDTNIPKQLVREYEVGDRIGQLVIVPFLRVDIKEVEELSSSSRGTGGFGSSNG